MKKTSGRARSKNCLSPNSRMISPAIVINNKAIARLSLTYQKAAIIMIPEKIRKSGEPRKEKKIITEVASGPEN